MSNQENFDNWYKDYLKKQESLIKYLLNSDVIDKISNICYELDVSSKFGSNIYCIGNGGSAANASHFVEDLGKGSNENRLTKFRPRQFNDFSYIMAIANDYSYEEIFSHQLKNEIRDKDVLIALSVSGTSKNVIEACKVAAKAEATIITICGNAKVKSNLHSPEHIAHYADFPIIIPDDHFGRVEDISMTLLHMLCYFFMEN